MWSVAAGTGKDKKVDKLDTIKLAVDDGQEVEFFVLEQTQLMGIRYYLVMPSKTQEDECYILKESAEGTDDRFSEVTFVDDEEELEVLYPVFRELLEDSDMEVEF